MLNENYLKCIKLRKKLQEKVKGRVFVNIYNDILTVYIINKGINRKYTYKTHINNVPRTYVGEMVHAIEYNYRKFINDKFLFIY